MAYYYKINDSRNEEIPFDGIQIHRTDISPSHGPTIKFDFSKHVVIELLDNITPEVKLWEELGLIHNNQGVIHKRIIVDSHRVHCRRAVVVCASPEEARALVQRVSQRKIMRRCVCAVVAQDLLSDLSLFEKQIMQFGDHRPQHQYLYVTDLNRSREPRSLAQYLREKFAPFGTILSVFVAEDGKDGYAYPEGIIKFAYLSEAFAAELAYDQCVMGMERLSVTTHHNILLSQCDLKVRLREAQMRHSDSFNYTCSFSGSLLEFQKKSSLDGSCSLIDVALPDRKSIRCSALNSINDVPPKRYKISDTNNFQCSSPKLVDLLDSSCRVNLVDCLKDITMSSNISVTRELLDDTVSITNRCNNTKNTTEQFNLMNESFDSPFVTLDMEEFSETGSLIDHQSTRIDDYAELNENTKSKTIDSDCSYSEDVDNYIANSSLSENRPCSNMTIATARLPEVEKKSTEASKIKSSLYNGLDTTITPSQKGKKSFSLSSKLSLKSQRLDLSQISHSESTSILPTSPEHETNNMTALLLPTSPEHETSDMTTFLLPTSPEHQTNNAESDCFTKTETQAPMKSLVVRLERLSPSLIRNKSLKTLQNHFPMTLEKQCQRKRSNSDKNKTAESLNSAIQSLPTRRSSRLVSRQFGRNFQTPNNIENTTSALVVVSNSPLRAWLKSELSYSSNNRVISDTPENSKKIVCATIKKDVLVSVGCSHMTCDFCYPRTTNLLFGFA